MAIFFLILSICLLSFRSILMKYASAGDSALAQMVVIFGTAAIGSFAIGWITNMQLHRSTVIYACLFGGFNFLSQYLYLRAMRTGMASKVVFISSCSFLLQTIFSIIAFSEPFTLFKFIGIIMICCAQFCFSMRRNDETRSADRTWFLFAVLSMLCSGMVGIFQKCMGKSSYPNEIIGLSAIACSTALLLPCMLLTANKQWKIQFSGLKQPRILILSFVLGFVAIAMNTISTQAARYIDGSIVFPVTNCGSLILTMICTHILFRDRLTKLQFASVMLGIGAITLIGL